MKPFNFESFLFRLNLFCIVVIFILLVPTSQAFRIWFSQNDRFWMIPIVVLCSSVVIWVGIRAAMPLLIRLRLFRDRRREKRKETNPRARKFLKILMPALGLGVQMLLIILLCLGLISFMKGDSFDKFLSKLPYSDQSMRKPMHF